MKHALLAFGLVVTSLMAPVTGAYANPLAELKGKKRVIVLFAKSRSDAALDKQIELLRERRPDLRERDLIVLVVEGQQDTIPAIGYAALPRGSALELRERFDATKGFAGVLIGKDGTEKLRWTRAAEPQTIFDLIDAMPMRLKEVGEAATN